MGWRSSPPSRPADPDAIKREGSPIRVIAGVAKGRRLHAPSGRRTRPTSDRVKEALFSILQRRLADARVLDLYAGSGALGIEALSRGAASASFVEQSQRALDAIRDNLHHCDVAEAATVIAAEVGRALSTGRLQGPFDLALMDPPYDTPSEEVGAVLESLVDLLAAAATVVVEADRHACEPAWPDRLRAQQTRRYGDTVLHIATLAPGEEP